MPTVGIYPSLGLAIEAAIEVAPAPEERIVIEEMIPYTLYRSQSGEYRTTSGLAAHAYYGNEEDYWARQPWSVVNTDKRLVSYSLGQPEAYSYWFAKIFPRASNEGTVEWELVKL